MMISISGNNIAMWTLCSIAFCLFTSCQLEPFNWQECKSSELLLLKRCQQSTLCQSFVTIISIVATCWIHFQSIWLNLKFTFGMKWHWSYEDESTYRYKWQWIAVDKTFPRKKKDPHNRSKRKKYFSTDCFKRHSYFPSNCTQHRLCVCVVNTQSVWHNRNV